MSRLDELLPASLNGIPFDVRNEVVQESGRRIIIHDYPNSSVRYIEDQGELPPRFRIKAFVHGFDFLDRADRLERELKKRGKCVLRMPTFGEKTLYAMPYTKNSRQKNIGEIIFDLEFIAGRATSGPSRDLPTLQTVYVDGEKVREAVAEVMEEKWQPPSTTENILAAISDLKQMSDAVSLVTATVNNSYDIESAIRLININAPKLIQAGDNLSTSFVGGLWGKVSAGMGTDGFKTVLNLTRMGGDLTLALNDVRNAYQTADDIGDWTILLWPATTFARAVRNANRLVNVNAGRLSALSVSYEVAAATDYPNAEEVQSAWEQLEAERERLMVYDTADPTIIQSDQRVRNAVDKQSQTVRSVFDQKETVLPNLTTIDNKASTTAYVQAYTLYAEQLTTTEFLNQKTNEVRALNAKMPADKLRNITVVPQAKEEFVWRLNNFGQ